MRTSWTAEQRRELDAMLRSCVECGLCLPHCATWLQTGNDVHSPRGRLLLLSRHLHGDGSVTGQEIQASLDLCIGCMACTAACPSGVPFTLLDQGKRTFLTDVPGPLVRRLDDRNMLRWIKRVVRLLGRALRRVWGDRWRARLDRAPLGLASLIRKLGLVPQSPDDDRALVRCLDRLLVLAGSDSAPSGPGGEPPGPPAGEPPPSLPPGQEVIFFLGCASANLLPGTSVRLRELLAACGCRVVIPGGQDCCGALAAHTGRLDRAAGLARRNSETLSAALREDTLIVVEAAGCSLELAQLGEPLAGRVIDAGVLLDRLPLPRLGPVPLKVVCHDPCHARHGQGIWREPRSLLRRIPGLQLVEPDEAEVCCGGGGAWGLTHAEVSSDLGRRKAANLVASGADLVVTGNPGCLGQIGDALRLLTPQVPILPLTDLVWYAWQRGQ